jgi:hypothetical protein
MEKFPPDDADPRRRLTQQVEVATEADIEVVITIAHDLLSKARYEITRDFGVANAFDGWALGFMAVEAVQDGASYNTARVIFSPEIDSDVNYLYLEYDEEDCLVDQASDGNRSVAENAFLAEGIIEQAIEFRGDDLEAEMHGVFDRLTAYLRFLQDPESIPDDLPETNKIPITAAIQTVAESCETPTKETRTSGVLSDGTTISITGTEYLFDLASYDFDNGVFVRQQIEVKRPDSRVVAYLQQFHDGSIKYENYTPPADDEPELEELDDEFADAFDKEMRAMGLYAPNADEIRDLTDALIEFSLQEAST